MINTIFQAYRTIEDINQSGLNGILVTTSDAVPILPALILFALFVILSFGSYYSTIRRLGRADFPASFAVAGFVCVIVSILMSLIPNFISTEIVTMTIVLEIIFVGWLYFSRD